MAYIRNYSASPLTSFVLTMGNNPVVFDAIASLRSTTPKHTIVVWNNGSSEEHSQRLRGACDLLIDSNQNLGCAKSHGFAFLYLEYDWLISTQGDLILQEGWWDAVRPYMQMENVGIIGESFRGQKGDVLRSNQDTLPDGLLVIRRKLVQDIGSIDPAFGLYGCETDEFQLRALNKGWAIISINLGTVHAEGGKSACTEMIQQTSQEELNRETGRSCDVLTGKRGKFYFK